VLSAPEIYERWARYPRSSTVEHQLEPVLDEALDNRRDRAASYTLECHGRACKLAVNEAVAPINWLTRVMQLRGVTSHVLGDVAGAYFVTDGDSPDRAGFDCTQLEDELVDAETRLDEDMSPVDRWPHLVRSPVTESRILPYVVEVYGADPFECRGNLCRIEHRTNEHSSRIREELGQTFNLLADDVDSNHPIVWVEFRDDLGRAQGNAFIAHVRDGLAKRGADITACKQQHRTPGEVAYDLQISEARIVVQRGGSLATKPFDVCMRRILDAAIASVPLPEANQLPVHPFRFWTH